MQWAGNIEERGRVMTWIHNLPGFMCWNRGGTGALLIEVTDDRFKFFAAPDEWVVLFPDHELRVLSDVDFTRKYQEIP